MATKDFIAAIELSSSKIAGIAGKKNYDGSLQVQAYAQEDAATFIRKGLIYNVDVAANALTSIINKLQNQLGSKIAKVYVGVGGQSMHTVKNCISRTLNEGDKISQELIDELYKENLASICDETTILEVVPQEYIADNHTEVNPVGIVAQNITAQYMNIVARSILKSNLERSLEQVGITMADLILSPLAQTKSILTDSEMRSGCAIVDFGADTTTLSIYKNNLLRFLCVLPLGMNNVVKDICTLQMEEEDANWLLTQYGSAICMDEEGENPATCTMRDGRTIAINKLNDIVEARIEEILQNIVNLLQLSGYEDNLFAGVVLTGGGSNLPNLEEAFKKKSGIEKVKTAKFTYHTVHGANELSKDGTTGTLIGLLLSGTENCCLPEEEKPIEGDGQQGELFEEEVIEEAPAQEVKKPKEEKPKEEEKPQKPAKPKKNFFSKFVDKIQGELFDGDDDFNNNDSNFK